jgi:hypothetical protein
MRAMAEGMNADGMLIGTRFPPTPIISRTYQVRARAMDVTLCVRMLTCVIRSAPADD